MKLTLRELANITGGIPSASSDDGRSADAAYTHFDSRKIDKRGIFFALSSDKQDGAKFISDAFAKGAAIAVAETNPDNLKNVLVVKNSLEALRALAAHVRAHYKGFVIGITGSSGKTTVKELVAQMLSAFGKTCYNEGSLNNHIGTPYSLCKLDNDAPYAIFEMGMDHAGEISSLVELVQPHLAAITNVFPMHMEYFKSFKDIAFAKAEIFEKVVPFNGKRIAIINADTSFADEVLVPEAKKHGIADILTFGKMGRVKLKDFAIDAGCKTTVDIEVEGKLYRHVDLGLGERFAYNANFAAAVAYALGLDMAKAMTAIADFAPLKGRGRISSVKTPKGFPVFLIDDSYNGQPEAVRYAIRTLNDIPKNNGKKIALIGKMAEIGEATEQEHREIGKLIADSDIDIVIGVGPEAKFILDEVPDTKKKIFKETVDGLYEELTSGLLEANDIILIKGAHYSSRVFEVADKLLAGK